MCKQSQETNSQISSCSCFVVLLWSFPTGSFNIDQHHWPNVHSSSHLQPFGPHGNPKRAPPQYCTLFEIWLNVTLGWFSCFGPLRISSWTDVVPGWTTFGHHRWVPLNPNMDNLISRIIPSPVEITLLSLQCKSASACLIQNPIYWKEFYLAFLFRINREAPEFQICAETEVNCMQGQGASHSKTCNNRWGLDERLSRLNFLFGVCWIKFGRVSQRLNPFLLFFRLEQFSNKR